MIELHELHLSRFLLGLVIITSFSFFFFFNTVKPIQSGRTALKAIPNLPGLFCKYINLESKNFIPRTPSGIKVLLTASLDKVNEDLHDPTAVWSEEVSTKGFKACIIIAGRGFASDFNRESPYVHWQAFQEEFLFSTPDIRVGSVVMDTWYTGTQCKNISMVTEIKLSFNVYASVQHTEPKGYENAMTVWSEITTSSPHGQKLVRICARELQNFDGIHKGIIVVRISFNK